MRLAPDSPEMRAALARAYVTAGRRADAEKERDAYRRLAAASARRTALPGVRARGHDSRGGQRSHEDAAAVAVRVVAALALGSLPRSRRRSRSRPGAARRSSGATSSASTPRSCSSTSWCATRRAARVPRPAAGRDRGLRGRRPAAGRELPLPRLAGDRRGARGRRPKRRRQAAAGAAAPPRREPGESRHLNLVTLLFDQLGPDGRDDRARGPRSRSSSSRTGRTSTSRCSRSARACGSLQQFTTDRDAVAPRGRCARPASSTRSTRPPRSSWPSRRGSAPTRCATSSRR